MNRGLSKIQNERFRMRWENKYYPLILKDLRQQASSFTSDARQYGLQRAMDNLAVMITDEAMVKHISALHQESGLAAANRQLRILNSLPKDLKKRGSFGYNEEWTKQIVEYFREYLFSKVVIDIPETTRQQIQQAIEKGIDEGWSIEEILAHIEHKDFMKWRARRIVRTESTRAINYGNNLGAQKFEFKVKKEWAAIDDRRTRPAHHAADGQKVDPDGQFTVGGEKMDFPGDPDASAENTVNCRCQSLIVPVRDKNGRLVPKQERPKPSISGSLRREIEEIIGQL